MWNMLLVLIIAIIIFMLNPLKFNDLKPSAGVDKKTKTEVNTVVEDAQKQVDYANQMQKQVQDKSND